MCLREGIITGEESRTDGQLSDLSTLTSPVQAFTCFYSYLCPLRQLYPGKISLPKRQSFGGRVSGAVLLALASDAMIFPLESFLPVTIAENVLKSLTLWS